MIALADAVVWTGAAPEGAVPEFFSAVCTDTRSLRPGSLFAALRGERFDGHSFAAAAMAAGAGAILAETGAALPPGVPALRVPDTAAALRALAAGWRRRVAPKVLGITGSAGKTTTKEFCAHLLEAAGPVARTLGNFNNAIGLPLSILAMPEDAKFGVFEIGTNHPGEIAPLAELMSPDAAAITNVGPVHIGNFGSEEAIADEKANLLRAVPPAGFCILERTGAHFEFLRAQCAAPVIVTSCNPAVPADFTVVEMDAASGRFTVRDAEAGEQMEMRAPRPGVHQIADALVAIAAARRLGGVPLGEIAARIGSAPNAKMRWELSERDGVRYVNDAYNANPLSMAKALETFADMPCRGRRIAVLGDMGELGEGAEERLHREVGRTVAKTAPGALLCVGPRAKWIGDGAIEAGFPASAVQCVPDAPAAAKALPSMTREGDLVLLKASRSVALERALPV